MKLLFQRTIGIALCALLLTCLVFAASAESYDLDEALGMVGQGYDRIELTDDFSEFAWDNAELYTYNEGKIMILWRDAPLKAYELLPDRISDDYTGKDVGEATTYLCAKMMEQIPEELRASTPEEAGNILLIETTRLLTGQISSFDDTSLDYKLTEEDVEKMLQGESLPLLAYYSLMGQSSPKSYTPVFSSIALASMVNAETGGCSILSVEIYPHDELRANPEAADIWDNMQYYEAFLDEFAMVDHKISVTQEEIEAQLENIALVSAEDYEHLNALYEQSKIFPEIPTFLMERYWEQARELMAEEENPQVRATYELAIEAEDFDVFGTIVAMQSYAGVSKSDGEIKRGMCYIGVPTEAQIEEQLQETVDLLDDYLDWDLTYMELFA